MTVNCYNASPCLPQVLCMLHQQVGRGGVTEHDEISGSRDLMPHQRIRTGEPLSAPSYSLTYRLTQIGAFGEIRLSVGRQSTPKRITNDRSPQPHRLPLRASRFIFAMTGGGREREGHPKLVPTPKPGTCTTLPQSAFLLGVRKKGRRGILDIHENAK